MTATGPRTLTRDAQRRSTEANEQTALTIATAKPGPQSHHLRNAATWSQACATWARQLARAEPLPIAQALLLVFIVAMALSSNVASTWIAAGGAVSCQTPADDALLASVLATDARLLGANAAGLAAGGLVSILAVILVLRMVRDMRRHNASLLRLESLYVSAIVVAETCVFYELAAIGALSRACVTQLGGYSADRRVVLAARFLFWACAATSMLAYFGKLARASPSTLRAVVLANLCSMTFGLLATLVDGSFAAWICLLCVALLSNLFVVLSYIRFLRRILALHRDALTHRLLSVLGPVSLVMWLAFPVVWTVLALGWVSPEDEQLIWPVMDLLSKALFCVEVTVGDFSLAAADAVMLQSAEDERHAAELAEQARRQVMRYLFHELRVPLNSLALGIDDLSSRAPAAPAPATVGVVGVPAPTGSPSLHHNNGDDDLDRPELLAMMKSSVEDMTHLLNSYLSFDKIESGNIELELEETPLRRMLQDTIGAFAAALEHRSLEATLTMDPRVPALVVFDPRRIRQCVANFLSNAIKFSPVGGIVALRAELVEAGGGGEPRGGRGGGVAAGGDASRLGVAISPCSHQPPTTPSSIRQLLKFRQRGNKRSAVVSPMGPMSPMDGALMSPMDGADGALSSDGEADGAIDGVHSARSGGGAATVTATGPGVCWEAPSESAVGTGTAHYVLRVSVTDVGIGISVADQPRLFSSFVQIRPGQNQNSGGSGLGLAICRRIVELHGGRVGVQSVAGSYSCFYLELPLGLAAQPHRSERVDLPRTAPALDPAQGAVHPQGPVLHAQGPVQPHGPRNPGAAAALLAAQDAGAGALSPPPGLPFSGEGRVPLTIRVAPGSGSSSRGELGPGSTESRRPAAEGGRRGPPVSGGSGEGGESFPVRVSPPGADSSLPPPGWVGPYRVLTCALVIDDIASNRLLLARLLRRRGVGNVISVEGGNSALATWRAMDADAKSALQCVFCDKEMPGDLDGHDTVAALRREGYSGAILGVTGNALEGDRAAFVAAGADTVLIKPVDIAALTAAMAMVGLAMQGVAGTPSPMVAVGV